MLDKLPVPGRPNLDFSRTTALAVDADGGRLDIFFSRLSLLSSFSLSLWKMTRYRPEILSQKAVKPKTTNRPSLKERG